MKTRTTLILALALLLQTAYSQTNPLLKYLPDNASVIMSFSPVKMAGKIPGDVLHQSFLFRSMMKGKDPGAMNFLSDLASSGIDFSRELMVVATLDSTQKNPVPSMQLYGVLKNESLFSSTIKKFFSEKDSLHAYGLDKILFLDKGKGTIAWNNEIFVVNTGADSKMKKETMKELGSDSASEKEIENRMSEIMDKIYRMQREKCFDLLTPRYSNMISSNHQFIDLLSKQGDIKVWSSGAINPFMQKGKKPFSELFSKYRSLFGNNKTAVINFENGKITAQGQSVLNEPVASIYNKYPSQAFNAELTKHLPAGKVLLMINVSYNPEMLKEIIHQTGIDAVTDNVKKMIPIDMSSFHTIFKNNLMIAVIKSDKIDANDSMTKKLDGIQVFLAMPIADNAKFLELKSSVSNLIDSLKKSGKAEEIFKKVNPSVRYNDNLVVLSMSPYAASAFLNNDNAVPVWLQSNTKYPVAMSIDLKEIFTVVTAKKGNQNEQQKKMMDMVDQILIYSGNYENGSLNSMMEFRFTNQSDNALKQIFDMINMAAEGKEKGKNKN